MKLIAGLIIVSLIFVFASSGLMSVPTGGIPAGHTVLEQSFGRLRTWFQNWSSYAPIGMWEAWAEWLCPASRRGRWRWYRLWRVLYRLERRYRRQVRRWRRMRQEWQELMEGIGADAEQASPSAGVFRPEQVMSNVTEGANMLQGSLAEAPGQDSSEVAEQPARRGPGRPREIATEHVACPNGECASCGVFGPDPRHDIVGFGLYTTVHGEVRQMFRCNVCREPFSETAGTPFFGLKTPVHTVCLALKELTEGLGIRAVARIHGVKPDTVLDWLRKAGQHCEQVSTYMMRDLEVSQVQLDELWTFVRKKERVLSEWEKLHTEYGDTWVWTAFDPVNKLVLAVLIGDHTEEEAVGLLSHLRSRLVEACLPLLTSDALPHYVGAILRVFGVWIQPERNGDRGRLPNPRQVPSDGLNYATLIKEREKGRVVSVTTRVVYGCLQDILAFLEPLGQTINTSFVERMNLTLRHLVSRLHRKTLCFSKKRDYLAYHLHLGLAYYHFCRHHRSLRERLPEPIPSRANGSPKLWQQRTPAMAAGLTDHLWSIEELLAFRVPRLVMP